MRAASARRSQLLSATVDGDLDESAVLADLGHDLRFQAELVQYRKLVRGLRSLRDDLLDPAPGLLDDVLFALDDLVEAQTARSIVSGRRVAYLGGLAAATAAGVGSAIVLARRRRLAA